MSLFQVRSSGCFVCFPLPGTSPIKPPRVIELEKRLLKLQLERDELRAQLELSQSQVIALRAEREADQPEFDYFENKGESTMPTFIDSPPTGAEVFSAFLAVTLLHFRQLAGDPSAWGVEDVVKWLASNDMHMHSKAFKDNAINGSCLKHMDDESLRQLGVTLSVHRKSLMEKINALFQPGLSVVRCSSDYLEVDGWELTGASGTPSQSGLCFDFPITSRKYCRSVDTFLIPL
jgi:hypothetical protein